MTAAHPAFVRTPASAAHADAARADVAHVDAAHADSPDARELLARVHAGDRSAFHAMFAAHAARLCAYAYQYLRSRALAEEAVQDVFCDIWARYADWEPRVSVDAYLYGAVRRRAMRLLDQERRARRWRDEAVWALDDRANSGGAPAAHADQAALTAELDAAIARAVAQLPRRAREVFLLHRREQLTYAQIADRLGLSVKTVEIHMGRALKALRTRLAEFIP